MLVQNHIRGPLDPKYVGDYRVVALRGNQVEVRPSIGGPTEIKHVKHVKYILLADQYIKQVPDYAAFGRKTTLRMNPDKIAGLCWNLSNTYHTTKIGQTEPQTIWASTHCVDIDTLSYAKGDRCGNWSGTTLNTNMNILQSNREPIVCSVVHNSEIKR